MAPGLTRDELRRADAVLEACERSASLRELLTDTLAAVDEHLGHPHGAFVLTLAEPPLPGRRAHAAVIHGAPPYVHEEYFERWADLDPLGSEAAGASYQRRGFATVADLYSELDSSRRRCVDDFLRRNRWTQEISMRLPAGWTDAYLTLMGSEEQTDRDRLLLAALVPRLTELLREHLPRGLDGPLSVREGQVAELVALGFSNREIAEVLNVEEDTVKKHVSHAMKRLGMDRRTQLAVSWATGRRIDVPAARGLV